MEINKEGLQNWLKEKARIEKILWEGYREDPQGLIEGFHDNRVFQILFHEVYEALENLDRSLFTKEQLKQFDEVMAERKAMGKDRCITFTIKGLSKEHAEEILRYNGMTSEWSIHNN